MHKRKTTVAKRITITDAVKYKKEYKHKVMNVKNRTKLLIGACEHLLKILNFSCSNNELFKVLVYF